MVDVAGSMEIIDELGSTSHFNGTVGTTPVSIPSSANKIISEFYISNVDSTKSAIIYVSLDGGTTFKQIGYNSDWSWSMKGSQRQIKIKGDAVGRAYEIVINFEDV